ncbi:FG-GAP repeat protein [Streptomyces sp. M19]
MASGDVDGDGYADVAVSAPVSLLDEGRSSVTVLRGGPRG